MAQTKRKRRTKHRGNAAGTVERRGRTSRPDPAAEKRRRKEEARSRRSDRLDTPPTWSSAFKRAGITAALFFLVVLLLFKDGIATAIALGVIMLAIYTPMSYYTDRFVYNRRQRQRAGRR